MGFANRSEAGRRLAAELAGYRDHDPVILALPRGGVPVAAEIAGGAFRWSQNCLASRTNGYMGGGVARRRGEHAAEPPDQREVRKLVSGGRALGHAAVTTAPSGGVPLTNTFTPLSLATSSAAKAAVPHDPPTSMPSSRVSRRAVRNASRSLTVT